MGCDSGKPNEDVSSPNCGDDETLAQLCMCPNKDRVKLFTEGVNELNKWLEKRDKTNQEISYWLSMYMKF